MKKQQVIEKNKKQIYQKIFLITLIFISFALVVVRVVLANTLVDQSVEVSKVERLTQTTLDQIERTRENIRSLSSLQNVTERASLIGFSKISVYSYLPKPQTVAENLYFSSR